MIGSADALDKLNSAPNGDGIEGLRIVHSWYTMMAGLGLTQMRQRLLHPPTPVKETDVAEAMEAWDRLRLELKALEGTDWVELPERWEKAALERFLIGTLKDALDGEIDSLTAAQLRKRILAWALRRKQEAVVSMEVEPQPLNAVTEPPKKTCADKTQHSTPYDTDGGLVAGLHGSCARHVPLGLGAPGSRGEGQGRHEGQGQEPLHDQRLAEGQGQGQGEGDLLDLRPARTPQL